jgi:uncharacterized membrane protein YdcZ (DUF606 family)
MESLSWIEGVIGVVGVILIVRALMRFPNLALKKKARVFSEFAELAGGLFFMAVVVATALGAGALSVVYALFTAVSGLLGAAAVRMVARSRAQGTATEEARLQARVGAATDSVPADSLRLDTNAEAESEAHERQSYNPGGTA